MPNWLGRTITILGLERISEKQVKKLIQHLIQSLHKEDCTENYWPTGQNRDKKLINSLLKELEKVKTSSNDQDFNEDNDYDEDTS